jgi:branched-chain amino acid transport system substrate-binding protein
MRRLSRRFLLLLAPALLLAAALLTPPGHAQAPVKIGASLSMTGTYAQPGNFQREGYLLCEKDLNARGGLLGRKVQLVLYDDQSQPATGVRLYEKLITEDKVDVVMGPYSSPITEAVANVTEKYQKILVSPLASTTSIFKKGRKNIFMILSPAEVYLEGLIDLAARNGLKTIALLNEDTLFPKSSVQGAIELAQKRGLKVVHQEAYPKGNTDFSAILIKVKAANPDVVGAATYFDDAVALTRQMKELDLNPRMFGVTVGGDIPKFYELLGKNAEFVYSASQWESVLPYPGAKEFFESYRREYGHDPSYHSAAGYAGCLIFAEGVKRAGSLEADKVRKALLELKFTTLFGDYAVDQDGFQTAHKMVTLQWQDGKRAVVWPESLATAKLRFPTPPWSQR